MYKINKNQRIFTADGRINNYSFLILSLFIAHFTLREE